MSSIQEREYYSKYMRTYYQRHKEYWRNYYLQRKTSSPKRGTSRRNRRDYYERINTAWSKAHSETRLTRLIKRLGATAAVRFSPGSTRARTPPEREEKRSVTADQLFRGTLLGILNTEGFTNMQVPSQNGGVTLRRDFSTFQALAIKDNDRCIIEVAVSPFKVFTRKRSEYLRLFLDFFQTRYFLCFLKPDCSRYYLLELKPSRIRSVSLGLKAIAAMKPAPKIT